MYYIAGDGRLGWPNQAPYDAIHVGAAAPELPKHVRSEYLSLINRRLFYF